VIVLTRLYFVLLIYQLWIMSRHILLLAVPKKTYLNRGNIMGISNYWMDFKVIKKSVCIELVTTVLTTVFFGLSVPAHATFITINAIAPLDTLDLGDNTSEATDFCIGASGDGDNENGLGSGIIEDYGITPDFHRFISSQNVTSGGIGIADSPLINRGNFYPNNPTFAAEAICFDFPRDPVLPGESFSVVIEPIFEEFEAGELNLTSGLNISECYFSYSRDDDGNEIIPKAYLPAASCGVTLDPPDMIFAGAGEVEIIFDDGNVRLLRVVSTPSMGALTLVFFGGLYLRRSFGLASGTLSLGSVKICK
jgi:hypothetical protein